MGILETDTWPEQDHKRESTLAQTFDNKWIIYNFYNYLYKWLWCVFPWAMCSRFCDVEFQVRQLRRVPQPQRTEIGAWGVPRCGALRSCQASRVMMLIGRRSTRCHSACLRCLDQIAKFGLFWWQNVEMAEWLNKVLGLTWTWIYVNRSMWRARVEVGNVTHLGKSNN